MEVARDNVNVFSSLSLRNNHSLTIRNKGPHLAQIAGAMWAPFFSRFTGEDVKLRPRARWALTAAFGASGPIGFAAGAFRRT